MDPPPGRTWTDRIDPRKIGWMRTLLILVPIAIGAWLAGAPAVWRFALAGAAIIPLAGLMGESTEHLARRAGPGIGGLLNAAFGNAAELIIALFALFRGLDTVVKASLTGSIVGNLLLVFGASLLAGGLKHPVQRFNRTAAGVGATMMVLASIGMLVPAIFYDLIDPRTELELEHELSVAVCVVLILTYGLHLVFSLVTHKDLFNPAEESAHEDGEPWTLTRALVVLLVSTCFVAWMSEVLVGAVEETSRLLGMTEVFVGVIVVAIVGNAAEHSTAIWMALKNKMDLSVGIALSSALQIALFVAPVLVFASYLRDEPMDLLFTTMEVVAVIVAVLIARMVAEDGESNWLEGAMLLMLYVILGLAFYLLPVHDEAHAVPPREPTAALEASADPVHVGPTRIGIPPGRTLDGGTWPGFGPLAPLA